MMYFINLRVNRSSLILFFLSLCFNQTFAGHDYSIPPGYLGKRLNLLYNLSLSPALLYPSENKTFINYSHSYELQFVKTRKTMLGIGLQNFNSAIFFDYNYEVKNKKFTISSKTAFVSFTRFYKNFIAPAGLYYKFDFGIGIIDIKHDSILNGYVNSSSPYTMLIEEKKHRFGNFSGYASFGNRQIISNCFIIDYGFKVGAYFITAAENSTASKEQSQFYNFLYSDTLNRIFSRQIISIYLGIGFLH